MVAPRVGAWIETLYNQKRRLCKQSHPVWVRGLKQEGNQFNAEQNQVAPRVGAWIETKQNREAYYFAKSHPVWVRGLKLTPNGHRIAEFCRTPCGCVD